MATPKVFAGAPGFGDALGQAQANADQLNAALNPFNGLQKNQPYWQTGARAFIRCGGRPLGVTQTIGWRVSYATEPVQSVDTNVAWDLEVNQLSVSATLRRIVDPTGGPETESLISTAASSPHQPMVELQIFDKLGTSLFYAKGMFTAVATDIAMGQLSTYQASFIGTIFQHYVSQEFVAYGSIAGGLQGVISGLKNLTSTATGGIL